MAIFARSVLLAAAERKSPVILNIAEVHFDYSPYKENMEKAKNVVDMCHPLGISVEAELGAVGGEEGGRQVGAADKSLYTNPTQAAEFAELTGVDALAGRTKF
jgi:tagatose 1,6-diphosphate aldolase GatY/KbaY